MRGPLLLVALSCLAAQSYAAQCNVAPICCNDCTTCFPAGQPLFDCFASCTSNCPTVQQCLQFDPTVSRNIANAGCSFAQESCSPTLVATAQHVTPIECYFIQFGECVGSSQGFFTSECASFSRGTCSEQQFYNYFIQFVTDTCQAVAVRVLGP